MLHGGGRARSRPTATRAPASKRATVSAGGAGGAATGAAGHTAAQRSGSADGPVAPGQSGPAALAARGNEPEAKHAPHPPPWGEAGPAPPPPAFRMSSGAGTKPALAPTQSSETICNYAAVQMLTTPQAGGAPNLVP